MKELKENNIQEKQFKPREFKNSVSCNNKSGYRGVYFDKTKQKWRAQIRFDNKCYKLGLHTNKEDAILARQEAELKLYGKLLDKNISIAENNIAVNKIISKNKKVKENKDILIEEKMKDVINKIYGNWEVKNIDDNGYSLIVKCIWCGAEYKFKASDVFSYKVKSCNCQAIKSVELPKERHKQRTQRITTPYENIYTSEYIGVSWDANHNKWSAQIFYDGKNHKLGRFDKETDAANARLQAEIDHFGKARNIKKSLLQDFNHNLNKKKYNINNTSNKNQFIEIELSYNEYNKVNDIIKYFSNLLNITEI